MRKLKASSKIWLRYSKEKSKVSPNQVSIQSKTKECKYQSVSIRLWLIQMKSRKNVRP